MTKNKKWIWISIAGFVATLALLSVLEDSPDVETKNSEKPKPTVSFVTVSPRVNTGSIDSYAEIQPRWQTSVLAYVNGEVLTVESDITIGSFVQKGQQLASIDPQAYKTQLVEAEYLLADSRIQYLQEKNRTEQAIKSWKRSGINTTPSDLVLNKPQLHRAEKALKSAEEKLALAKRELEYTHISAPFSGYITQRHVSLGQMVEASSPLFDLISEGKNEIHLSLTEQQWKRLNKDWKTQKAKLHSENGELIGTATIREGGAFLNPETRLYSLALQVNDDSDTPVRSGSFVKVKLPATAVEQSLRIPEGSIGRDGYAWFINRQNILQRYAVDILFYDDAWAVISTPHIAKPLQENDEWRVVVTPLAYFLPGLQVNPTEVSLESITGEKHNSVLAGGQ
ncbi:efflux RND transporter periplasmic adaptor subunit [Teredinibacter sp. KSP-S5-2]|uniref:efflux RND transporter periplasmic adaptor subunit n=1 Tax=Teredinibacter sp. KSP-S5-2 TaxID=3034506 RepID=UPI0029348017|nr:efflux RND transporter periplasmic adaptor subunit [Teredinibacter sp. KSP-S5-2]WNO09032.1 efflux RND transporter periplasmic adaptor subunit [Teredinibacter sp. KSP-S5-2]